MDEYVEEFFVGMGIDDSHLFFDWEDVLKWKYPYVESFDFAGCRIAVYELLDGVYTEVE